MQRITLTKILLSGLLSSSLFAGGNIDAPDNKSIPTLIKIENTPTSHTLNRIYVDRFADLMWQDAPYSEEEKEVYISGNGHFSISSDYQKTGSFKYSKNYCKKLTYGGYTDWRLPKSTELQQQLQETDRTQNFYYKTVGYFWASKTKNEGTSIHTEDGYSFEGRGNRNMYIRCVREMNEKDPQN